jgi:hypothetical protein
MPRFDVQVPGMAALLVLALAFAPTGLIKPLDDATVLDEEESRYQYAQVVEDDAGRRILQLNEGWAVHSVYDPDTVLTGGIWDHFLVVPAMLEPREGEPSLATPASPGDAPDVRTFTTDPETGEAREVPEDERRVRMLVIGSAAGTAKRAFAQLRPDVAMTSVELDRDVTSLGRTWFHLEGEVEAADGRPFLDRTDGRWDIIHVDAYRQPYIPFYLTTREFFELAKDRLEPGGVFSINVGSTPDDPRINEAVAATMREVFPLVARYRAEQYNEVIVAVHDEDVTLDDLRERIGTSGYATGLAGDVTREERRELRAIFNAFAAGMVDVERDPDRVLTDDRAPVEWMTDRMIFGEAG